MTDNGLEKIKENWYQFILNTSPSIDEQWEYISNLIVSIKRGQIKIPCGFKVVGTVTFVPKGSDGSDEVE